MSCRQRTISSTKSQRSPVKIPICDTIFCRAWKKSNEQVLTTSDLFSLTVICTLCTGDGIAAILKNLPMICVENWSANKSSSLLDLCWHLSHTLSFWPTLSKSNRFSNRSVWSVDKRSRLSPSLENNIWIFRWKMICNVFTMPRVKKNWFPSTSDMPMILSIWVNTLDDVNR